MKSHVMVRCRASSMRSLSVCVALMVLLPNEKVLSKDFEPLSKEALCSIVEEYAIGAWTARKNGMAVDDYRVRETKGSYERMERDDLTDSEKIARNIAAGFSVTFSFDQRFNTEEMTPESHGVIAKETCLAANLHTRYIHELERYKAR